MFCIERTTAVQGSPIAENVPSEKAKAMAEPLKAEPLVFPLAALPDTAQRGDRNR